VAERARTKVSATLAVHRTFLRRQAAACIERREHAFSGRFVKHTWFGLPGPLRHNHQLRTLGSDPLVLFFKLFDHGKHEVAFVEALLSTGGIILGNGQAMILADSIVILSASHMTFLPSSRTLLMDR
jgi:hypothetical protein